MGSQLDGSQDHANPCREEFYDVTPPPASAVVPIPMRAPFSHKAEQKHAYRACGSSL